MPLLVCPNDDTAMQSVNRSGVEFDFCPSCRGVWLDRGELEKLMAAAAETAPPLAAQAPFAASPPPRQEPRPEPRYDDRRRYDDDDDYRRYKKKRPNIFDIFD